MCICVCVIGEFTIGAVTKKKKNYIMANLEMDKEFCKFERKI